MTTYYKVLNEDGFAFHGGSGAWGKPSGKRAGRWHKVEGDLVACQNGLHLCRRQDLVRWLGPAIFTAEVAGDECIDAGNKVVVRKARLTGRLWTWNETTAHLFAADCAELALQFIPGDRLDPFVAAINAARGYARGEIGDAERSAAESAAWSAAWSAARSAARLAAESAAESAAWSAAESAARSAQTEILFDYLEGRRS